MKTLQINIGLMSNTLEKQLEDQGLEISDVALRRLEKIKKSIDMLYAHQYITESQRDKMTTRFFKEVEKEIIV